MERLFIREKRLEKAPERLLGAVGLCRGSGVTAAASSAALFMAGQGFQVRYTECAQPRSGRVLLYDSAAMSERFCGRSFCDVYALIAGDEPVPERGNKELGVDWRIMTPESRDAGRLLTEGARGRLIRQGMRAEISVFDFDCSGPEWFPYIRDMDAVLVLVDPLPSRISSGMPVFRKMKSLEQEGRVQVRWLVNRMCSSVSRRQIRGLIKSREIYWMEDLGRSIFCQNEYHCRFHWENECVREHLEPVFQDIFRGMNWISDVK